MTEVSATVSCSECETPHRASGFKVPTGWGVVSVRFRITNEDAKDKSGKKIATLLICPTCLDKPEIQKRWLVPAGYAKEPTEAGTTRRRLDFLKETPR